MPSLGVVSLANSLGRREVRFAGVTGVQQEWDF
jgi:hypothetical protein